ncbi:hypothetical protein AYR54_08100 [Loigolactobacillus backii]|uniref:DUF4811 domain-containing protein n=1 Tax=Loigolactobacillus backii TaxID=375175 RepID=UPI0007F05F65|nr:DUF4811 domain-containing protein [Loigolactobacillus backii]ANK60319.1 hypothetical protein AYR52_08700 [Loigolactobacillus backii]ANK65199.1 hypothetical protein AYR54_08100 [Loigolactobacillus backii]ANK67758.1 hypothetical protein AYR55_08710 [Loigolactobacillus backii]OLF70483.1 hypothetical protein ACX53_02435 [Loigolactobacillus backii]PIO87017.1 hypothetical protein B8A32_07630 [Loigolactobacillus backii]
MILVFLTIGILIFSGSMIFLKKSGSRSWINWLSLILIFVSMGLITLNDTAHFGMHEVTSTRKRPLLSSTPASKMNLLLYQPLGTNGTERIYLYRTNSKQVKPTPTSTVRTSYTVKKGQNKAQVSIATTRWVYRNQLMHTLFGITGENNQFQRRHYTFKLTNAWQTLSTTAAKKIQK